MRVSCDNRGFLATLLFVFLLSVSAAAICLAQPFGESRGHGPTYLVERAAPLLGLSDTQKAQIKDILESHKEQLKNEMDAVFSAHKRVEAAINSDSFDEQSIRLASAALASAEQDLFVLRGQVESQVSQLLSDEQKEKATALRELFHGPHEGPF